VKITLNSDLTLYFDRYFPTTSANKRGFKHQAVLSIGGNIGDVRERFKRLYFYLFRSKSVHVLKSSPILKNPPFGYLDQPDFFNAVLLIETNLTPKELLKYMLYIEKKFKRIREFKDSPRTLDIDMIFYDNISINTRYLTLPHPRWSERRSVLIPLEFVI
jgi:2-amino-4-hydroxy-6-hydroxymethyldihydropteridine diphosphokinase